MLIVVAAYMWPTQKTPDGTQTCWMAFATTPQVLAITVNNGNGPGSTDPGWGSYIQQVQNTGTYVYGYVNTGSWSGSTFTPRSTSAVETDCNTWYSRYPNLDGIYLDNVFGNNGINDHGATNSIVDYYMNLSTYLYSTYPYKTVYYGCGGYFPEYWLQNHAFNMIIASEVAFNGSESNFPSHSTLSRWVYNLTYPSTFFVGLLYAGSATPSTINLGDFINACANNNIEYVYASDHSGYTQFPTFWSTEVTDVANQREPI